MSTTEQKIPGPDHPITVEPDPSRVVVTVGDRVVVDTTNALRLQESTYPPAFYVPVTDLDQTVLEPSDTTTYCPYKGHASYYSIKTGDSVVRDAIWFYESPYEAVADIVDHVAFYPDRVTIEVSPAP